MQYFIGIQEYEKNLVVHEFMGANNTNSDKVKTAMMWYLKLMAERQTDGASDSLMAQVTLRVCFTWCRSGASVAGFIDDSEIPSEGSEFGVLLSPLL